jgi:CheY-like chemotaxis protein
MVRANVSRNLCDDSSADFRNSKTTPAYTKITTLYNSLTSRQWNWITLAFPAVPAAAKECAMSSQTARILCVDSSSLRLQGLIRTLGKAGFETWTARGASDAVCLASALRFDALVMDRLSSSRRADIWKCLAQDQPNLPILVHEGTARAITLCGESEPRNLERPVNPEVLLAMLVLLLGREHKAVALKRYAVA